MRARMSRKRGCGLTSSYNRLRKIVINVSVNPRHGKLYTGSRGSIPAYEQGPPAAGARLTGERRFKSPEVQMRELNVELCEPRGIGKSPSGDAGFHGLS